MISSIFKSILLFSILIGKNVGQLEEGDFCYLESLKILGQCKLVRDCAPVQELLQTGLKHPQICRFKGTVPIVCCPPSYTVSTEQSATNVRALETTTAPAVREGRMKSYDTVNKRKCIEYGNYVHSTQQSPINSRETIKIDECPITNGYQVKAKEFPFAAIIGFSGPDNVTNWLCGGTLISERFVLTAAHCLQHLSYGEPKIVRIGDINLTSNNDGAKPQDFTIVERIKHPNYISPMVYNDIALLKLDRPAKLSAYLRPACLYSNKESVSNTTETVWSRYNEYENPELTKVEMANVSQTICNEAYEKVSTRRLKSGIVDSQICAQSFTVRDNCQGNSGNGLLIQTEDVYCSYSVVGVSSFGMVCGVHVPNVYTRVFHYIDWIENIVWPTE